MHNKFIFWEHVVSAHGTAAALSRESPGFILILCIPVHEKNENSQG